MSERQRRQRSNYRKFINSQDFNELLEASVESAIDGEVEIRIPPSPPSEAYTCKMMWSVSILKSGPDGQYYVGSTNDLRPRIQEHQKGQCNSTKARRPLELVAYVAVKHETTARELEKYFRTGSGKATLRNRILASEARRA